jgi:hypothetical protein
LEERSRETSVSFLSGLWSCNKVSVIVDIEIEWSTTLCKTLKDPALRSTFGRQGWDLGLKVELSLECIQSGWVYSSCSIRWGGLRGILLSLLAEKKFIMWRNYKLYSGTLYSGKKWIH